MARLIPLRNGPRAYRMTVELDGATYALSLRYNARDAAWRLDLGVTGAPLLVGIKLVNSEDLLAQHRHIDGLPPGRLRVVDVAGRFADPDATTIGTQVVLVYDEAS
jgi:hypothetical protein